MAKLLSMSAADYSRFLTERTCSLYPAPAGQAVCALYRGVTPRTMSEQNDGAPAPPDMGAEIRKDRASGRLPSETDSKVRDERAWDLRSENYMRGRVGLPPKEA
jgi:hypothetical protein